jgi:hypothetical protein
MTNNWPKPLVPRPSAERLPAGLPAELFAYLVTRQSIIRHIIRTKPDLRPLKQRQVIADATMRYLYKAMGADLP